MKKYVFFTLLIFILNQALATQQENIYSFEWLLNQTLSNSPRTNISRLEIDEALADYDYALSQYFPSLSIGANTEYSKRYDNGYNSVYIGNDSLSSSTGYQDSLSLILRYDLFKFGQDYYRAKSAKTHIDTVTFQKCSVELEISLNLLENYYKALNLKNKIATSEELREIYQKLLDYSNRLNEVGESDKISLNEYKIQLNDLKMQIAKAKEEAKFTLNSIYQISGVVISNLNNLVDFDTNKLSKKLDFLDFDDTYISQKLQSEFTENELMLKSLQKAYYPTVSLYAKYDFYGSDADSYSKAYDDIEKHGYRVGLSLNWEIFDGGRRKAGINKQRAVNQKLEFQKQEERLKYEKEIQDMKVFLENEDEINKNLGELYEDTNKIQEYITRLNLSGEKGKMELLNSLIKTLQKKQDLKEHILETKFMLIKANLLSNQNQIAKFKGN